MTEKNYEIGRHPPVNQIQVKLLRASAIQAYANVEFSLSLLFSRLVRTEMEIGGLIFFRITNTHSRSRILRDLYERRFGDSFGIFWNSAMSFVRALDQKRNEIVHWHETVNIMLRDDIADQDAASIALVPPTGWMTKSQVQINETDLLDFIQRCDFIGRLLNMFSVFLSKEFPVPDIPWRDIFARPIEYPPPDTHPISRNYNEQQTPPEASRA